MEKIWLCLAHMSDAGEEMKYIREAFDTNWVAPLGANVDAFEADLKQFLGGEHEVLCLSSASLPAWRPTFRPKRRKVGKGRVSLGRQRSLGYLGLYGAWNCPLKVLCEMQCPVQQTL